ncbi:hypothetical protein J0H58_14705 [bacterium]|nr:hypothetical protein [bacterium]
MRTAGGATVAREDDAGRVRPLPLQTQIRSHSPSGFEWGYGGSGPAQLALAILVDSLGVPRARELYQRFKFQVIARLDGDRWELTREDVLLWVAGHKAGEDES